MKIGINRKTEKFLGGLVVLTLIWTMSAAKAFDEAWVSETIADASLAAPPAVTEDATIFGWTEEGELKLVRYGAGPYTCIASGSFSLRLKKPPLPYPDPMCLDQNAWAFLQALWSGHAGNPEKSLPTAPGLIWMLAGMNVSRNAVDIGAGEIAVEQQISEQEDSAIVQMTPHIMIMPLPFNKQASTMTTSYNLTSPLDSWIMAADKPHEHLMVHFSKEDVAAMAVAGN